MSLQARRPPGHAKRKALTHASDIVRLRQQGHTLAAIREALEDAGVVVSISTVRREVLKGASASPALAAASAPTPSIPSVLPVTRADAVSPSPALSHTPGALPGKAIAEAFMRGRSTNPLFLKETST